MALYIDRHFWLVLISVTIVLCCVFAARAAASLTDAPEIDDAPRTVELSPTAPSLSHPARGESGAALVERNMFCDSCQELAAPIDAPAIAGDQIPLTTEPVLLVATNMSSWAGASFASVVNTTTSHSGAYAVGQQIPGIGRIESIRRAHIDFVNDSSGRLERVKLGGSATKEPPVRNEPGASKAPAAGLEARLDEGVKQIDETTFEIDRGLFDEVTANPTVIKGGRARPHIVNGSMQGMHLYAVRPNSAFARLGLKNGDTLRSVNGIELTSADPDKWLEAYTKLRTVSSLQLTVDRGKKTVELTYRVR